MNPLVSIPSAVAASTILTVLASCGGGPGSFGYGDGGGGGGTAADGGTRGTGSSTGNGTGSSTGSGNGSSGGGQLTAPGLVGLGDAALPDGAPAEMCTTPGATRSCCGGTQTCMGNEFLAWGPCLDSMGAPAVCVIDAGRPGCGNISEGFAMVCDAGPPPPPPPPPSVCNDPTVSNEPEILVGFEPATGQTVGMSGQIKVWVNDENSPFIAPGEMVDNTTGRITMPGNRTATAADGLLYEPALYISPQSPTNGGTPLFPQWIKGSYNNNPPTRGTFTGGAPIDPAPPGTSFTLTYSAEFIWDVSALGLPPGMYVGVFSVHDGDHDRAIGCINITITP
jgi:hypothetical protein